MHYLCPNQIFVSMKKLLPFIFLMGCIATAIVSCQKQRSNSEWLRLADEQVYKDVDSLKTLLSNVKRPLELKGEERLLYGWLLGYQHYCKDASMVEDSLVVPAADAYINRQDTARKFMSYQLKADYLKWIGKPREALAVLDEGTRLAEQMKDTLWIKELQVRAGRIYCFVLKDYPSCTNIFRRLITLTDDPMICYSLGLAMALERNDSSSYYMSKAADLCLMEKDTTRAVFILRNMIASYIYANSEKEGAIKIARRIMPLIKGIKKTSRLESPYAVRMNTYESLINSFLHLGQLDSAQHYIDKSWEICQPERYYYLGSMNLLTTYQAVIDYTRKGTFDVYKAFDYNDSLFNDILSKRSTINQVQTSNKQLTAEALELIVARQNTRISLLVVLLIAVSLAMTVVVVVNLYRRKLRKTREAINGYIMAQQENENRIRRNEQMIADLQHQIADGQEVQEQLEEQKLALATLQQQTEALKSENVGLQQRIEKYKHQPSEEEIRKLKESACRMHQLEERERELTAELANNNELMRKLREKPKFLGVAEWKKLEDITNRVYNHFTIRLKSEFENLTEVDVQLCILLKLRFTVSQIAILTATSPSSVSVQKNRLKKRLLQKDEHLFEEGQTLDMYLWMY